MDIKPLGNRILVKQDAAETVTAGGIVIPGMAQEKPLIGTVEACGPDVEHLKNGCRVLFASYAGTDITVDGADFVIMAEDDVYSEVLDDED